MTSAVSRTLLRNMQALVAETCALAAGNSFENCIVCVVVPHEDKLMAWAQAHSVPGSFAEVCKHKDANAHILKELVAQAKLSKLKGYEVRFSMLEQALFCFEHAF